MKWKKTKESKRNERERKEKKGKERERNERGEEVRGELIQEEVKAELRILGEADGEGGGEREVEQFRRGCSRRNKKIQN